MDLLRAKIKKLPRKHLDVLSEDEINKIQAYLKNLYQEFGVEKVLSALKKHWSLEQAFNYFVKSKKHIVQKKKIKTIAVYYIRINNGGIERVMASLINQWVKQGFKVVLLTAQPPSPYDFKYDESVKRYVIPPMRHMKDRLVELKKICLEEKIDVYVNNQWLIEYSLWEIILLNELNVSYITHVHSMYDFIFNFPPIRYLQPNLCRLSDAVVTLSEATQKFYKELGCNAFLVNNPTPKDLINNPKCNIDSRRMLLIGRITFEKNPMDALRVFKKIHKSIPDVCLDVVGQINSFLKPFFKAYIKINRLSKFVKLYGKVDAETAQKFYAQSCCMLFTSFKSEGYVMTILEAKSFGLPTVMYDLDYLTLVKGYKGIVVAPIKNIEELSKSAISILKDRNLRQKLSEDAYNHFLDFANYDLGKAWRQIFNSVKSDFIYNDQNSESKMLLTKLTRKYKRNPICRFVRFADRISNKN